MIRRTRWILAWLACTLASLGFFAEPRTTPIHPDEVYWIGSVYYYHLAFERRDWTHADWGLQAARENPPVAKYVLGIGLALAGQHIVVRDMLGCFHLMFQHTPGAWGEGEDYAKRVAVVGAMNSTLCRQVQGGPGVTRPRALPYLARYVMLACAALTSLLIFYFGSSVANRATGLLASQLLLLHPYMIHAYNRTMADPVMLLLSAAAAFAGWHFFQRFSAADPLTRRTGWQLAVLNGVLLALACGAKLNSLIVVFLFGSAVSGAVALAWRRGDRERATFALAAGGASLAVAFTVFVAINPAIIGDIRGGLVAVVRETQLNTAVQARVMFQDHLVTIADKFRAVSGLAGGVLPFALSVVVILIACFKSRRAGTWFVVGWWAIAVVCVTVWLPFDWSRYILPILLPFTLLVAHAIVEGARAIAR